MASPAAGVKQWQPWSPKLASGVTAAGSHFVFNDMEFLRPDITKSSKKLNPLEMKPSHQNI